MKAILINSTLRTVSEVEVNPGDTLQSMYDHLNVDMIEVAVRLPNRDVIFVDEEGMLKDTQDFFLFKGTHQPFAGSGILVGTDKEGNTVAATATLEDVKRRVRFMSRIEVALYSALVNGREKA